MSFNLRACLARRVRLRAAEGILKKSFAAVAAQIEALFAIGIVPQESAVFIDSS